MSHHLMLLVPGRGSLLISESEKQGQLYCREIKGNLLKVCQEGVIVVLALTFPLIFAYYPLSVRHSHIDDPSWLPDSSTLDQEVHSKGEWNVVKSESNT